MIVEQSVLNLLGMGMGKQQFNEWLNKQYNTKEKRIQAVEDGLFSLNMIDYQGPLQRDAVILLEEVKKELSK